LPPSKASERARGGSLVDRETGGSTPFGFRVRVAFHLLLVSDQVVLQGQQAQIVCHQR
jgi:hypothetical protein